MKAFQLLTALCFLCSLVPSFVLSKHTEWTKLILTHHWPQSFCSLEHCQQHFKYWTLHGLWPNHGIHCMPQWKFNMTEIEDLRNEMDAYWPNLLHPTSEEFWKYEWYKHGTCATTVESLNSQHKYFSKALELYHKFDLTGVLAKASIVPGEDTYQAEDIENAIMEAYGGKPKIQCIHPTQKGDQVQQLGQIEICVDRDFALTSCEKSVDDVWNRINNVFPYRMRGQSGFSVCDQDIPISYPPVQG